MTKHVIAQQKQHRNKPTSWLSFNSDAMHMQINMNMQICETTRASFPQVNWYVIKKTS